MSSNQRAARAALEDARIAFERVARSDNPDDAAADLIEAWDGAQLTLKSLAGTSALAGQEVVRELRQRNLLSLDEAHALVDFHAATDRARHADYTPSRGDRESARTAYDRLVEVVERSDVVGQSPVSVKSPPPIDVIQAPEPAARPNILGRVVAGVAVASVLAVGVYYALGVSRTPNELRRGRAAYAAGDRPTAISAFNAAAGKYPTLAEPHVYLGRIARESGNLGAASAELRRAVELEPDNPLAHRELAAYLLASGQLDLARVFYERAIRLDPNDLSAQGFMGCTLIRLGRADVAQRFLSRAGAGPWQQCATLPPTVPPAGAVAPP